MKTSRIASGLCALIVLTALPVDAGAPLTLAVTPAQSIAPATMRVCAHIEPSADNRRLTIVADGSDFYRSSEIQLDGDQAPSVVELYLSNLPGGEYEVSAVLTDAAGHHRARARQAVRVLAMFGSGH